MNYENYTELSEIAKKYGLRTPWRCFEAKRTFEDIYGFLEICKRIEILEDLGREAVGGAII